MQVIYNACDIQLSFDMYVLGIFITTGAYIFYKNSKRNKEYNDYTEYLKFNQIKPMSKDEFFDFGKKLVLTRKIVFISNVILFFLIVVADTWHYFYIKEIKCENGTLKWVNLDDKLFKYDDVLTTTDNINCKKKIFNRGNYLQFSYMVKNGKKVVVKLKGKYSK